MRIGIVSREDIDIFSPKEGASVKLYYTMTSLAALGHQVFFISGNEQNYYRIRDSEIKQIEYPEFFSQFLNGREFYRDIAQKLGIPHDFSNLYHPAFNLNMWLRTLYVTLKEDIEVLQSEFTAFGVPSLFSKILTGVDVSLVEHNVESVQIPQLSGQLGPRGEKTIRFIEKWVGTLSDYTIVVSPEDKQRLKKLGIEDTEIIPHGVDLDRYNKGDGERIRQKLGIKDKEKVLVFHGVLNYSPNREAVKEITKKILPELREELTDFKILIIGEHPPEINEKEVITTGFVEKLEDYLDAADLAIVPLKRGGGTRLKILEYLATRIPIVSTEVGAEGIDLEDERHILISPISDFAQQIKRIIKNSKLRERLKTQGYNFVTRLDWKEIAKKYQELYRENKK